MRFRLCAPSAKDNHLGLIQHSSEISSRLERFRQHGRSRYVDFATEFVSPLNAFRDIPRAAIMLWEVLHTFNIKYRTFKVVGAEDFRKCAKVYSPSSLEVEKSMEFSFISCASFHEIICHIDYDADTTVIFWNKHWTDPSIMAIAWKLFCRYETVDLYKPLSSLSHELDSMLVCITKRNPSHHIQQEMPDEWNPFFTWKWNHLFVEKIQETTGLILSICTELIKIDPLLEEGDFQALERVIRSNYHHKKKIEQYVHDYDIARWFL